MADARVRCTRLTRPMCAAGRLSANFYRFTLCSGAFIVLRVWAGLGWLSVEFQKSVNLSRRTPRTPHAVCVCMRVSPQPSQ